MRFSISLHNILCLFFLACPIEYTEVDNESILIFTISTICVTCMNRLVIILNVYKCFCWVLFPLGNENGE